MLALCTAEVSQYIKTLERDIDIVYEGWARDQVILTEDEMVDLMNKYQPDILFVSYDPITKKVIESSKNLKLIVCTRANPVNVDYKYLREKHIPLSFSPGRNSDSAAEFTVALMLSVMRRIPNSYRDLKNGLHTAKVSEEKDTREGLRRDVTWALGKDTPYILYKGYQMKGRTVGIVGYGSIGRRVADICRGFGMKVMAYDPFLPNEFKNDDAVFTEDILELAEKSDVLTVHCKDTPETYRLINKNVFNHMKKDSFFINTSRGILVNEEDLIDALKNKTIGGAALDVFDSEPIAYNHPFLTECENVIITPHLAGATYDAIENHTIQLVEDVKHFLNNEPLEYGYY